VYEISTHGLGQPLESNQPHNQLPSYKAILILPMNVCSWHQLRPAPGLATSHFTKASSWDGSVGRLHQIGSALLHRPWTLDNPARSDKVETEWNRLCRSRLIFAVCEHSSSYLSNIPYILFAGQARHEELIQRVTSTSRVSVEWLRAQDICSFNAILLGEFVMRRLSLNSSLHLHNSKCSSG